tara:strand:+ start:655 stop:972 length:318 start_codon:yes stop_codon:yes gene_type:complete
MEKTLVTTTTDTTGSAVLYLQDDDIAALRIVATGTVDYTIRCVLTSAETPSTGHQFADANGASGSILWTNRDSNGGWIPVYAVYVSWETLQSTKTITILAATAKA